jgi:branched-chain amino acid transport system ATP-binding protein
MTVLETAAVSKQFGGLKALNEVSFSVDEGEIKAVIGPNGAGKTTLFNIIAGSMVATGGSVLYRGTTIDGSKAYQVARMGIQRTFQNLNLAAHMTVLENVMLGRHCRTGAGFLSSVFKLPAARKEEAEIEEKAREMLDFFSLSKEAETSAGDLPFGRQRAVEFARAMAAEPDILLLDEPASGLNMHETEELSALIRRINGTGITILLVEHDMSLVMDISDDIVVLNFGTKIAEGSPGQIQKNRDVIDIYLGEEYA